MKSKLTIKANDARWQLHDIFKQYGTNIKTACQLRNANYIKFFDNI